MATLDFRLEHLKQNSPDEARAYVLLQYRESLTGIEELGFRVSTVAGDVAAGSIPVSQLDALKEHPGVVLVESSRPLKDETDVSAVAINLLDPHTNLGTIPNQGTGAVIGVIDSGFDLTHPAFRNDRKPETRILAAWDQMNAGNQPGTPPSGFEYGVEYSQAMINQRIAAREVLIIENEDGGSAHGTYVTGIAGGNGAPHGVFRGVAPKAQLILVCLNNSLAMGGSVFVLNAINYIQRNAGGRPVVINMSQGDNLGAHDGTSLLERSIDYLTSQGQLLVVKSAGNGSQRENPYHAQAEVVQNREFDLPFSLAPTVNTPVDGDTIELWYRRPDRFSVALKSPSGYQSQFVLPGENRLITFPNGTTANIYSDVDYPTNGDNHLGIILNRGAGWEAGNWKMILRGDQVQRGDFDAWADRPNGITLINFTKYQSEALTITLPGTARRIITVGGFVSRPVDRGETGDILGGHANGSSLGPTRDGRVKPDISAPSTLVMAPRRRLKLHQGCQHPQEPHSYDLQRGTSMAAPHVAGVVALLWAEWPQLTPLEIRTALYSSAKRDFFTGATPNTSWGHGKLDAGAAYQALSPQTQKGGIQVATEPKFELQFVLQNGKEEKLVMFEFRVKRGELVASGLAPNGDEYDLSFVVSKVGGGECYVCTEEPCPPNRFKLVNPCPVGLAKKQLKESQAESKSEDGEHGN